MLGDLGKKVSGALVDTIKGAGDVVGATTEVTRKTLVEALKATRDVVNETSGLAGDTVTGAIHAANRGWKSVEHRFPNTVWFSSNRPYNLAPNRKNDSLHNLQGAPVLSFGQRRSS